ncbi:MAG TPA: serine/threonine-protein kinase [Gemmatimonadales bacterium]|nr:serine/threonine-protein kinase [Gemmatimonadales bacterium]
MTTLLDRVRAALSPDYEVERELASGGMGIVFVGRDVALDRRVAIKIIRPDRATARAAERFVREARILASISHPNLIPVHRAGESGGFFYYVMDYLEAETLAERLARGPLAPAGAVAVARDVLDALEAVHRRGVVHRDVKPGNIFLVEGRAMIGDLGVAKATGTGDRTLTDEGMTVGSPGYMAPEQTAGGDVTPAADVYAMGLVLFESLTGRGSSAPKDPVRADWSGVPRALVAPLQRALAWAPADRWQSAAAFRAALAGPRSRAHWRAPVWAAAAAVVLLVLAAGGVLRRWRAEPSAMLRIVIRPFDVQPPAMRWLGDSLPAALARSVGGAPDIVARPLGGESAPPGALVLHGSGEVSGTGALRLGLRSEAAAGKAPLVDLTMSGSASHWGQLADSLGYQLLLAIWTGSGGKLAADLPLHALPVTRAGVVAWMAAERLFARAQWGAAFAAYRHAVDVDSTCLLCRVRLTDVGRWLGQDQDSVATSRYRTALDSFPPHYRRVIEAGFAPADRRFAMLHRATDLASDFGLAWFVEGDEIFHRGPLAGYSRHDAYAAMRRATVLWPDFAPAWEHLAWIAIGEGESTAARQALDSLERLGAGSDPLAIQVRALLEAGYRWRFAAPGVAAAYTDALLRAPAAAGYAALGAAARYQLTFDAPAGAIYLGERFERMGRGDLETPGLLAQIYAFTALGQLDSARAAAARLTARGAEPGIEVFLAELPAALLLADTAAGPDIRRAWPSATQGLDAYTRAEPGTPGARQAAWLLALLARRAGDSAEFRRFRSLLAGEPAPRPLGTLVDADAAAALHPAAALAATEPLLALDSASWRAGDSYFRAFLHLMRARWHARMGGTALAVRDLRWHENNDLRTVTTPAALPEAAEVDWSLGTLARWEQARLLDAAGDTPAACVAYAAVRRLWTGGDSTFAARARTARERSEALKCGGTR